VTFNLLVVVALALMISGCHENPELIWNDEAREKVCGTVRSMVKRFHADQKTNILHKFNLPEDFAVVYTEAAGEVVVGGVFLRLFIANPGWVLRKPKEFLTELLERWCALTATQSPNVSAFLMIVRCVSVPCHTYGNPGC